MSRVRVLKHGNIEMVKNPINPGQKSAMQKVTFIQIEGRGANSQLSDTTAYLNSIVGGQTGLDQARIHTQLVAVDKVKDFPIGLEFPGFINRVLHSFPQMDQQSGVRPRMIDGQPTFFTTSIDAQNKPDADKRVPNAELIKTHPHYFTDNVTSQVAEIEMTDVVSALEQQHQVDQALANTPLHSGLSKVRDEAGTEWSIPQ